MGCIDNSCSFWDFLAACPSSIDWLINWLIFTLFNYAASTAEMIVNYYMEENGHGLFQDATPIFASMVTNLRVEFRTRDSQNMKHDY